MIDPTTFAGALRLTELILAFAFILQSIEQISLHKDLRLLCTLRLVLSFALLFGVYVPWVCFALFILGFMMLIRFNGPYNGGSDRMNMLIISCLSAVHFMPSLIWQECILGYLALQLVLSYFMAGKVKVMNPEWRNGNALQDVFRFSVYPVSEGIRAFSNKKRLMWVMSWAVILFELAFPLALISQPILMLALIIATLFHFANACLFGLNRFFWVWLAAYPALFWLQARVFL